LAHDRLAAVPRGHARYADPGKSAQLGSRVLAFAQSRLGRQVGDGECFTLADQALQSAGARSAASYAEISPDADYTWGHRVALSALRPGDVLQFRDYQVQTRTTYAQPGAEAAQGYTQTMRVDEREHHTAIVERVEGPTVVLLEQNVDPGGRIVQRNRLAIANEVETVATPEGQVITESSVRGEIRAYRPVAASSDQYASLPEWAK
jgi:PAS domain-containing protein